MWQSQGILNVFKMLALKNVLWETKTFLKKLEDSFLVQSTMNQKRILRQKPMLRQIEWGVQNGPITKNRRLPPTTSFFWKFNLSIRIEHKFEYK